MAPHGTHTKSVRMCLPEFSQALRRVGIHEEEEHMHVYAAITSATGSDTVSLEELSCALSAVSPSLVLEDLRQRLVKSYKSLVKAAEVLEFFGNTEMDIDKFVAATSKHFSIPRSEGKKLFRLIDIDCNGRISRLEFLGALRLSEASLFLEDLRKKVRQRFRSIKEVLMNSDEAVETLGAEAAAASAKAGGHKDCVSAEDVQKVFERAIAEAEDQENRTPDDFHSILALVQLTPEDTKTLFDLVDIDQDKVLTANEFLHGVRLFMPSCVLEDLPLRCLENNRRHVSEVFAAIPPAKREAPLDIDGLRRVMDTLGLAKGLELQPIYDLVEPRRGGLTINELVAALESACPGTHVMLPPQERDFQAQQQMRGQLSPFCRSASELRESVRQKLHNEMDSPRDLPFGRTCEPTSYELTSYGQMHHPVGKDPEGEGTTAVDTIHNTGLKTAVVQRCRSKLEEIKRQNMEKRRPSVTHAPIKRSYNYVHRELNKLEKSHSEPMLERMYLYYVRAGDRMTSDAPLLKDDQSTLAHHHEAQRHYAALEPPKRRVR